MSEKNLPSELQHLQNLINRAQQNNYIDILRDIIKSAAEKAPAADVVRIAKTILDCGVQAEIENNSRLN